MKEVAGFNPEQTAKSIMNKSFLKSRQCLKEETGSKFFKDTRVMSCSYVKELPNCRKAVPFYSKRDNTVYPTPSKFTNSWNSSTYSNKSAEHAGMGSKKPLTSYDPTLPRNSMMIPSFRPPYPNSSQIQIGKRQKRDVKHYLTTYGNELIAKNQNEIPTSHPGIQAFRNKWLRSRIQL